VWLSKNYGAEYHLIDEFRGSPSRVNSGLSDRAQPVNLDGTAFAPASDAPQAENKPAAAPATGDKPAEAKPGTSPEKAAIEGATTKKN
jgi:hypothetical protein